MVFLVFSVLLYRALVGLQRHHHTLHLSSLSSTFLTYVDSFTLLGYRSQTFQSLQNLNGSNSASTYETTDTGFENLKKNIRLTE